jgi:RHS repeat-associated protein
MYSAGQAGTLSVYDERDQLVRIQTLLVITSSGGTSGAKVVRYQYDLDGSRLHMTYPNGDPLAYERDVAGRLTTLRDWLDRLTIYTYHAQTGQLVLTNNVLGTSQSRDYDNLGRLTTLTNALGTTLITSDTATLDANGNPDSIQGLTRLPCPTTPCNIVGTGHLNYVHDYDYDRVNRLTWFGDSDPWSPPNISMSYDPAHNMAGFVQNGQTWTNTMDGADRLSQQANNANPPIVFTYGYDHNGNTTTSTNYTFAYDQADRPLSVTAAGTTANITYDGDGVRVLKTVGVAAHKYVYDRNGKLPTLLEDGNRRYVPGLTGMAYTTDIGGVGNPQLVYHTDQQGSVRAISNASLQLVYAARYDPYGNLRHAFSNNGYTTQPLGYTGASFDPEGAVLYLNARYYAPSVARFIQRDTVFGDEANPASLNRYAYAFNNPMVYTDPSGNNPCWFNPQCWSDYFADFLNSSSRSIAGWPGCGWGGGGCGDVWGYSGGGGGGGGGFLPFTLPPPSSLDAQGLLYWAGQLHDLTGAERRAVTATELVQTPDGLMGYVGYVTRNPSLLQRQIVEASPGWTWVPGIRRHAEANIVWNIPRGHELLMIASAPIDVCWQHCQWTIYTRFPNAFIVNPQAPPQW